MVCVIAALACAAIAQAPPRPVVPEQEIRKATEVKDRHTDALFRLPAVVGAGVGESSSQPGRAAIHVYLSRKISEKERRSFPKKLEGIPVELQETGPLRPLPDRESNKTRRDGHPKR